MAYSVLLKTLLAPALRERGFKGSGIRWELPDPADWLLLGFAKRRLMVGDEVQFGINLSAVSRTTWEEAGVAQKPFPAISYWPGMRLKDLAAKHDGTLWSLDGNQALEPLADELIRVIDDQAVPWLRAGSAGGDSKYQ